MSYAAEIAQYQENESERLTDSPKTPTGYSENFAYGLGQTVDQSLSISDYLVREFNDLSYSDRNDQVLELRANKTITDQEFAAFVKTDSRGIPSTDFSALADYANETYNTNIRNDESIQKELRDGIATRGRQAQDIFERQTTGGAVGQVLGGLLGYSLEPAGIAAIPLEGVMMARYAYTLSQATTRLGRGLQIAGISAAANMATEAAIQPVLFNWREKIGVDMTMGDALLNIASVGVLAGGITGAVGGIRTKKAFKGEQVGTAMNQVLKDGPSVRDIAEVFKTLRSATKTLDDDEGKALLKQTEDELNSVPDIPAEEHFEKMQAKDEAINGPVVRENKENMDWMDEVDEIDEAQLQAEFEEFAQEGILDDLMYSDIVDTPLTDAEKTAQEAIRIQERINHIIDICTLGR